MTTRLSLELLQELERGSLLDVGCGSGVVAIAGAKLGFRPVVAIDVDPAAVEATGRNAAANGVAIEVRLADAQSAELPPADVAVANISLDTVTALGPRLDCRRVVTAGYLVSEAPVLRGYRRIDRRAAEGWAAHLHARE